jgi:hypothetical protein
MAGRLFEVLKKLAEAPGPPGQEQKVKEIIIDEIKLQKGLEAGKPGGREALCHEPEARNPILDHRLRGWGPVVLYMLCYRGRTTSLIFQ